MARDGTINLRDHYNEFYGRLAADGRLTVQDLARIDVRVGRTKTVPGWFFDATVDVLQADIDFYQRVEKLIAQRERGVPRGAIVEREAVDYFRDARHFKKVRAAIKENRRIGTINAAAFGAATSTALTLLAGAPEPLFSKIGAVLIFGGAVTYEAFRNASDGSFSRVTDWTHRSEQVFINY